MEIPFWVLDRVVGSKEEDWRIYREGWANSSDELRSCSVNIERGIFGVYVSHGGETEVLKFNPFEPAEAADGFL